MAIGPYRHGANFQYQPYPIDFLHGLADEASKKQDSAYADLDQVSGLAASIPYAPGNEDLAKEVQTKYDKAISSVLSNAEGSDYRALVSDSRRLRASIMADPEVKKLIQNKEMYDKNWAGVMNNPANQNALYEMPGILDDNGKFVQNRLDYGNLKYLNGPDWNKSINEALDSVSPSVIPGRGFNVVTKNGLSGYTNESGYLERRGSKEYERARPGIVSEITNPTGPNYQYFKKSFEKLNGEGSFTSQNVSNYIKAREERFYRDKDMRQDNFTPLSSKLQDGNGFGDHAGIGAPQFVLNRDGTSPKLIRNTQGFNSTVEVPHLGGSDTPINQTLGADGNYTLGNRVYYKIGDASSKIGGDAENGKKSNQSTPIYNAKVIDNVVGYKITNAGAGSTASKNIGNLLTGSANGILPGASTPRLINGEYVVFYPDKKTDKSEKVVVQPVSLREIQGSETPMEKGAAYPEVTYYEELPAKEAAKWMGKEGYDFANEPLITYDGTSNKLQENITDSQFDRLFRGWASMNLPNMSPEQANQIQAYSNEYSKISNPNKYGKSTLSKEEKAQVINFMNNAVKDAQYVMDVLPSISQPKD